MEKDLSMFFMKNIVRPRGSRTVHAPASRSVEVQFGCNAVKMVPRASASVPVGAVDA